MLNALLLLLAIALGVICGAIALVVALIESEHRRRTKGGSR